MTPINRQGHKTDMAQQLLDLPPAPPLTESQPQLQAQVPGGGGGFATAFFSRGVFRISIFCEISHTLSRALWGINFCRNVANCLSYSCVCHTLSICRLRTVQFCWHKASRCSFILLSPSCPFSAYTVQFLSLMQRFFEAQHIRNGQQTPISSSNHQQSKASHQTSATPRN